MPRHFEAGPKMELRIPSFRDNSLLVENDYFSTDHIAMPLWREPTFSPTSANHRNNLRRALLPFTCLITLVRKSPNGERGASGSIVIRRTSSSSHPWLLVAA